MIECVSNLSGAPSIALIAHSQGTMETFAALSMPDIADVIAPKVHGFVALAPGDVCVCAVGARMLIRLHT